MTCSPIPAARSQYLLDLLAQVPDPRKRRGRRRALAGLLAVGIGAVIGGSRSFAAIGQWAADAGPDVLAVLGAVRGPADESTFRRAFALVSPDVLDRAFGAWLWTRAGRAGGRLVIAIDGKTVRNEPADRRPRRRGRAAAAGHLPAARDLAGRLRGSAGAGDVHARGRDQLLPAARRPDRRA
jgi:DDE_Tnp_1-associated